MSDNPNGGKCCIVISFIGIIVTIFSDPIWLLVAIPSLVIGLLYDIFNRAQSHPSKSSDTFYQEKKNRGM